MNDYARAVGKRIIGWKLSDDATTLTLMCADKSRIVLDAYGDCCSDSWFESMDIADNLFGTITAIEDIDMPDLGNVTTIHRDSADVIEYYGLKVTTDRGSCVIDYRNDSNGYYGGWVEMTINEDTP